MKELEDENRRLKKMYAEDKLKAEIAREAIEKVVTLSPRKHGEAGKSEFSSISLRLLSDVFSISETCF
ncbi:MAG: hypothetical protein HWE18_02720 [Gammaproteobacteria bacterium]|nr:hypothetical protein [Gammaproteobacteria bacterium]